jgi:hypothetical protein
MDGSLRREMLGVGAAAGNCLETSWPIKADQGVRHVVGGGVHDAIDEAVDDAVGSICNLTVMYDVMNNWEFR